MSDESKNRSPAIDTGMLVDVAKGYLAGPLGNGFRPGLGEIQGGYVGPTSELPSFPNAPSGFNPVSPVSAEHTPAAAPASAPASDKD